MTSSFPRAYQVRILDPEMQKYLQRHPFADGPDFARNAAARKAIKAGLRLVDAGSAADTVKLEPQETVLPEEAAARLRRMFAELGMEPAKQAQVFNDFGWKAKLIPATARRVLAVGCGDGTELLFLRAVLPEAKIMALDYGDSVTEQRKQMIGMTFRGGDMHLHLKGLRPEYDLIFSNHTLEHLYTPEETLATLCGLLVRGGTLISALPMESHRGSPFLDLFERLTLADEVHPLDYVFVDAGHPWKTNPGNLDVTLRSVGFSQVLLYQRAAHLTRITASRWGLLPIRQALMVAGNRILFGPAHGLLKVIFPSTMPEKLVKAVFAIERRTPFGPNKVKARFTHEVVIQATK